MCAQVGDRVVTGTCGCYFEEVRAHLRELLNQATAEIRTTSHLLHPPLLEEAGFASAAQWYVDGFTKRSGIQVKLECRSQPKLSQDEQLAFFRVLQESLTNALRHSGTKAVHITLAELKHHAVLSIRDFGKGIAPKLLRSFAGNGLGLGVGLAGMKQRILEMGGTMNIVSGNQGTVITASFPLRKTLHAPVRSG